MKQIIIWNFMYSFFAIAFFYWYIQIRISEKSWKFYFLFIYFGKKYIGMESLWELIFLILNGYYGYTWNGELAKIETTAGIRNLSSLNLLKFGTYLRFPLHTESRSLRFCKLKGLQNFWVTPEKKVGILVTIKYQQHKSSGQVSFDQV